MVTVINFLDEGTIYRFIDFLPVCRMVSITVEPYLYYGCTAYKQKCTERIFMVGLSPDGLER